MSALRADLSDPRTHTSTATHAFRTVEDIAAALRLADDLTRGAVEAIARGARGGALERATGLSAEAVLRLAGRRTRWDASELMACAEAIAQMPLAASALSEGSLSWSQFRAIVRAIRGIGAEGRQAIDALIDGAATALGTAEPEALVWMVEDKVSQLRADRALRREDRAIESQFLSLQPRLGGGGCLYGEADTESFASIVEALEAAAERPGGPADERDLGGDAVPSRGRSRMDALAAICESSLAGDERARGRPRPRLIATVDVRDLEGAGIRQGAQVLTATPGRPARLTPLATEVLACDADVIPVVFDGAHPVGIGDRRRTIPAKVRTALIARDGGCRFPGCGAPVAWCDAHHIIPPKDGGDASIGNLLLLCRRCHRRVHRYRWRISLSSGGPVAFRYRGRVFTSVSRTHPRRRE